jgi:hypothetical protein
MQIEIVRVLILLRIKFLMSIVLWIWIVLRMTIIFEVFEADVLDNLEAEVDIPCIKLREEHY